MPVCTAARFLLAASILTTGVGCANDVSTNESRKIEEAERATADWVYPVTGKSCSPAPFEQLKIGMRYGEVMNLVGKASYLVANESCLSSEVEYHVSTGGAVSLRFDGSGLTFAYGCYTNRMGRVIDVWKSRDERIKFASGKPCSPAAFGGLKLGMDLDEVVESVGLATTMKEVALAGDPACEILLHYLCYVINTRGSVGLRFYGGELMDVVGCFVDASGKCVSVRKSKWGKIASVSETACRRRSLEGLKIGMEYGEVVRLVGRPTREATSGFLIFEYDVATGGKVYLTVDMHQHVLIDITGWHLDESGIWIVHFGKEFLGEEHLARPDMPFENLRIGMSIDEVKRVAGAPAGETRYTFRICDYKIDTGGEVSLTFSRHGKLRAIRGVSRDESGKDVVIGN